MREAQQFLRILAAAMDTQPWDAPDTVPSPDRYLRALNGVDPLTEAEKIQLLSSPTARLHYQSARATVAAGTRVRLARMRANVTGGRLAADDGTADRAVVRTDDFMLSVERDGTEWLLILELGERLGEAVKQSGLSIAVRDSGDLTWITGVPDENRVLSGVWDRDTSPIDRLASHTIRLDLV